MRVNFLPVSGKNQALIYLINQLPTKSARCTMPSMDDMKQLIGKRIWAARKAKGLNRRQLAELVPGLNPSTLSGYEYGTNEPPAEMVVRLAHALEVNPIILYGLEGHALELLSEQERNVVTIFRATNNQGRDTIRSVAESQWTYAPTNPNNLEQEKAE